MRISDWSSDVYSSDLPSQIDAVAFRFEDVAIIVDHRNIGHARRERGADRRLRPADDERAAGEGYAPPGFGDRRTLFLRHQRVRSEEHTSELQSLMRISYAVFCLKTKKNKTALHSLLPITEY